MENYFILAEQFTTQAEPAYCGPASLIMVLNSLNEVPYPFCPQKYGKKLATVAQNVQSNFAGNFGTKRAG